MVPFGLRDPLGVFGFCALIGYKKEHSKRKEYLNSIRMFGEYSVDIRWKIFTARVFVNQQFLNDLIENYLSEKKLERFDGEGFLR